MRTRKNQFNVEWAYAKTVANAIQNGLDIPPIPTYCVWEVDERSGKETLIKTIPIVPMKVSLNGVTFP